LTEHVKTNLWLIDMILGAKTSLEGNRLMIEGVGFERKHEESGARRQKSE